MFLFPLDGGVLSARAPPCIAFPHIEATPPLLCSSLFLFPSSFACISTDQRAWEHDCSSFIHSFVGFLASLTISRVILIAFYKLVLAPHLTLHASKMPCLWEFTVLIGLQNPMSKNPSHKSPQKTAFKSKTVKISQEKQVICQVPPASPTIPPPTNG